MIYSDLLFLLGLLPCILIVSMFDKSAEYKNLILILSSLLFISWGKPFLVCIVFLTVFAEWLIGKWIDKINAQGKKAYIPLLLDGIMNMAVMILALQKILYVNSEPFGFGKYIVPLYFCFYTLRGFGYCLDVFNGKIKAEKNPFCLMTYLCGFIFITTGVNSCYGDLEPQIRKRTQQLKTASDGASAFVCGLSKAVLLAYPLEQVANSCINSKSCLLDGWIGIFSAFCFAYFLFTGFCDISYGIAKIMGFEVERNYANITARGFFGGVIKNTNTYLYNTFESLTDVSKNSKAIKALMVFVLCVAGALWYHISKSFLLAGIVLAIIALLELSVLKGFFKKAPSFFRLIVTLTGVVLVFGTLITNSPLTFFKSLAGIGTNGIISDDVFKITSGNVFVIIASLIMMSPLKNRIKQKTESYSVLSVEKYSKISILKTVMLAVLLILSLLTVISMNIKL